MGAVPKRENPRDVVLFAADVRAQIAAGVPLRIGSSSPRRAAFIPGFLERALPGSARVELCELRGNVDGRLRRLREPRGAPRQLDGVVLALAGLTRLAHDESIGGRAARAAGRIAAHAGAADGMSAAPAQGAGHRMPCHRRGDARMLASMTGDARAVPNGSAGAAVAATSAWCHADRVRAWHAAVFAGRASDEGHAHCAGVHRRAAMPGVVTRVWDGSQRARMSNHWLHLWRSAISSCRPRGDLHCASARIACRVPGELASQCARNGCQAPIRYALAARGVWVEGCAEGWVSRLLPTLASPLLRCRGCRTG
jgi:hypothetical protein